jgi:hypothetical protein
MMLLVVLKVNAVMILSLVNGLSHGDPLLLARTTAVRVDRKIGFESLTTAEKLSLALVDQSLRVGGWFATVR